MENNTDTPFVCRLNALTDTEQARYRELTAQLNDARQSVKELADGYAFRYKAEAEIIRAAAEFIIYERMCCPFFDFELAVDQQTNWLWLRLRGQSGIKEFIEAEFDISG